MIDYIKQLNAFNERCHITGIKPMVRVVYYTLLDMNNSYRWCPEFKTTVRIIAGQSGINSLNTVHRCIEELVHEKLIEYFPSKVRGKKSCFKIVPLCSSFGTETGTRMGTETGTEVGTGTGTRTGTRMATLNKQDKTRGEEKKNISPHTRAKFVPPTLDEINQYIMEKGLHVSAKDFLDYFTENKWVDAKGNKVQSWKGKLLTWEKFQPKQREKSNPQDDIDRAIAFFDNQEEGTA